MVQEIRRGSVPMLYGMPMPSTISGQIANYDDMVEAHKSAIQRAESSYQQADQLLAKHNEIEAMKNPIQARIYELTVNAGQD